MLIVIVLLYLIGREITLLVCLSLCKGSWKKVRASIRPNNLIARVFLTYLLGAKTQYAHIIRFGVISADAEMINTGLCIVFYLLDFKHYLLIWALIWLLHFSVFTFLFRKCVRK